MALSLNNLHPAKGSTHKKKRVGRGPGSGLGKTAGRGHKGQKSRSGYSSRPGFEGGQMPLQRRVPKRGFKNPFRKVYAFVNVGELEKWFEAGSTVSPTEVRAKGIIKHLRSGLKVLGEGDLKC